jgi:hypothetical protein
MSILLEKILIAMIGFMLFMLIFIILRDLIKALWKKIKNLL